MNAEQLNSDFLWRCYQRGYHVMVKNGVYFRQLLRPALSHVYFHRAVPLLHQYARANHDEGDLPPGFGDQMEACPLTARDLLHLDYAICLGYAELQGAGSQALTSNLPVLAWPGPGGHGGLFIATDALLEAEGVEFSEEDLEDDEEMEDEDEEETSDSGPPFDL